MATNNKMIYIYIYIYIFGIAILTAAHDKQMQMEGFLKASLCTTGATLNNSNSVLACSLRRRMRTSDYSGLPLGEYFYLWE